MNLNSWTQTDRVNLNNVCEDIFDLKSELNDFDDILMTYKYSILDSASILLSNIPSQNSKYLEAFRLFYKFRIALLKYGYSGISSNDLNDIIEIANSCPNENGFSVFGIRGFLPYCELIANKDNFILCDSAYSFIEPIADTVYNQPFIGVIPSNSPVENTNISIKYTLKDITTEKIIVKKEIRTLDGIMVRDIDINLSLSLKSIIRDLPNLPSGIYLGLIYYIDGSVEIEKIIKI